MKGVDVDVEQGFEYEEMINETVKTYSASILRFAFSYVRNHFDAEDIAQDVFVALIQSVPHFDNEQQKKSWLMKVTSNKSKDILRSSWRKRTTTLPDELSHISKGESDLLCYVLSLDTKYRIPIHLFYYEGYSTAEIASMLSIAEKTVSTRLYRARAKLRTILEEE